MRTLLPLLLASLTVLLGAALLRWTPQPHTGALPLSAVPHGSAPSTVAEDLQAAAPTREVRSPASRPLAPAAPAQHPAQHPAQTTPGILGQVTGERLPTLAGTRLRAGWKLGSLRGQERTVELDREGRFFLPLQDLSGLSPPEQQRVQAWLEVTASGYPVQRLDLGLQDAPGPRWEVDTELNPEPPLLARVVDGQGSPIAGAQLDAHTEEGGTWEWTDDLGLAALDLVSYPAGLRVHHEAYGSVEVQVEQPLQETLELVLSPTARLAGRVVDPEGRPIAGAEVGAEAGEDSFWTQTDGEGRFSLRGVPRGTYEVLVGEERVRSGVSSEASDLELVADLRAPRVRVVDAAGRPAHGATFEVRALRGSPPREGELDRYAAWAHTGPGEYGLVLARGVPFLLLAERGESQARKVLRGCAAGDVVLRLEPPSPQAQLQLVVRGAEGQRLEEGWHASVYDQQSGAYVGSLHPGRSDPLPSGPLHLRVVASGEHGASTELSLDLAPGEQRVEQVHLTRGVRIRVLLRASPATPGYRGEGARVSLWPLGGRRAGPAWALSPAGRGHTVRSLAYDEEHLLYEALPAGPYRLLVHGQGWAGATREVTLAGDEVRLELEVGPAD